jgi:hypothetical protein
MFCFAYTPPGLEPGSPVPEAAAMSTEPKHVSLCLQRLRTENRLLRQRVDLLEQESSNLADRLIQGQVTHLRPVYI